MASRDDVDVFWHLSPRLILVRQPSDNINIQDLHDTLRDKEQEQPNLIYPRLISTAGGENLGGGITVGLTSTLENARIGFQSHKEWVASGVCTSTDTDGIILTDVATTFSGVVPGNWLVNLDDGSVATVLNIDSDTQLTCDVLGGGDTNIFASGHRYKIMDVKQVEVDGGNLVAVDSFNVDIDAIFPTAGTQPVRTSDSSATQRSSEQIEYSTFQGFVWIDSSSAYSGTKYPVGTPGYPVNNISDAHAISQNRGIPSFKVYGPLTLSGSGLDLSGHVFSGHSAVTTTITILSEVNITDTEFNNCTIQGVLDGGAVIRECRILDLDYVNGFIYRSAIDGTIALDGGVKAAILSCYSNVPGSVGTAKIDMGSGGNDLLVRDYHGGLTISNSTQPLESSIDMSSGQVIFDNTVTDGTFTVRGVTRVEDNSTGNATVNTDQVLRGDVPAADIIWTRPISTYTDSATIGGYIRNKVLTVVKFLGLK